jgi:flagellar basal-body rod modification protein FlgD
MSTLSNIYGLTSQAAATSTAKKSMGKDDFLKMLIQQLRNQDPLDPMEGTEFAAQLAQFSSVEQLDNIQAALTQSIEANYLLSNSINNALAATFVGKQAKAAFDSFQHEGGENRLGYTLAGNANSVQVKIYDSSGRLVRTMTGTGVSKGDHDLTWDGRDDRGALMPTGSYRFEVEARDTNNSLVETSEYIFGMVSAVRFKSTGAVFVIGGVEVPLDRILEIVDGSNIDNQGRRLYG